MFRHAQKSVLSVAERSFVSGQKIILSHTQESVLSWTEKSSASTSGRKRDLSWTENNFNMHRKKSRHGQKKVSSMDRENLVMAVVGHRDCSRSNL